MTDDLQGVARKVDHFGGCVRLWLGSHSGTLAMCALSPIIAPDQRELMWGCTEPRSAVLVW
jgi:hypothetical protein